MAKSGYMVEQEPLIDRTGSGVPERQPLWQALLTSNLLGKAVWPDAKYAEHYGKAARLWLLTCHLLVSYAIGDLFANLGSLAEEYPGQEEGEGLGTVNSLLLGAFMKFYECMFSVKGVQSALEREIRNSQGTKIRVLFCSLVVLHDMLCLHSRMPQGNH